MPESGEVQHAAILSGALAAPVDLLIVQHQSASQWMPLWHLQSQDHSVIHCSFTVIHCSLTCHICNCCMAYMPAARFHQLEEAWLGVHLLTLRCTAAVPLYDSLGEDAVEYTVNHAETEVIFVQATKFPQLTKAVPKIKQTVQTIIYWGESSSSAISEIEGQVRSVEADLCDTQEKIFAFIMCVLSLCSLARSWQRTLSIECAPRWLLHMLAVNPAHCLLSQTSTAHLCIRYCWLMAYYTAFHMHACTHFHTYCLISKAAVSIQPFSSSLLCICDIQQVTAVCL